MSLILVIDAGTTAFKAVVFNRQMQVVGSAGREFEVLHPAADHSELNVHEYWRSCVASVHEALKQDVVDPKLVAAIAITSHTDTLFVLDDSGNPLTNAILWTDARARDQADRIQEQFGMEQLFHTTGQTGASSVHFVSRLAWFIQNNADLAARARYFMQTQDFFLYQLTGQAVLDQSIACCSLFTHLESGEYWQDMLDLVGVNVEKLSRIITPGEVAGTLTPAAAQTLGLEPGIPVVAGAQDATAAALAMGNVQPGVITEITGAALVIGATCDEPKFDEQARVPCFAHAVPGKYLLLPWCQTAGAALKWYRDQFFAPWQHNGGAQGLDLYDLITREASEASPGSDGVIVLPHFAGSGSPDFNPDAKAVIYGLSIAHQRKHISRALLESVAFMLKQNLDILAEIGVEMKRIISGGGGSRSPLWCQIKADVTGLPVCVSGFQEATATGAAILASKALITPLTIPSPLGGEDDLSAEASAQAEGEGEKSRRETVFKPNPANRRLYQDAFGAFMELNQLILSTLPAEDGGLIIRNRGPMAGIFLHDDSDRKNKFLSAVY